MREAAMKFLEADKNGDEQLTFEEFKGLIPTSMSITDAEAKVVFNGVDHDKDGVVTVEEYFSWVLANQSEMVADGFLNVFRQYDVSGNGQLTVDEFAHAVEDLGFPYQMGHELFIAMDTDESGALSYSETIDHLKNRTTMANMMTKKLIASLAFGHGDDHRKRIHRKVIAGGKDNNRQTARDMLDTSEWKLTATTAEVLREELKVLIRQHTASATDLYHAMTAQQVSRGNNGGMMDGDQFCKAFMQHGYLGTVEDLRSIFAELDSDSSGFVGITEFFRWIRHGLNTAGEAGQPSRAARTVQLTFQHHRDKKKKPLDEVEWGPATLREELQDLLLRHGLAPLDLIRAWDRDGPQLGTDLEGHGRTLTKKSFLKFMKTVVNDNELWTEALRFTVKETFEEIAQRDDQIDVRELQQWLGKGWAARKQEVNERTYKSLLLEEDAAGAPSDASKSSSASTAAAAPAGDEPAGSMCAPASDEPPANDAPPASEEAVTPAPSATEPTPKHPKRASFTDKAPEQNASAPAPTPARASTCKPIKGETASAADVTSAVRPVGLPPPAVVDRQFQESQVVLQDSQLRLAKALDEAAQVLGIEKLAQIEKEELLAARAKFGEGLDDVRPPVDDLAAKIAALQAPVQADLPPVQSRQQQQHTPHEQFKQQQEQRHESPRSASSHRMRKAELDALQGFGGDARMPSRSAKTISNEIVSLTRVLRNPSALDDWDGRSGGLGRAQSAPLRPKTSKPPGGRTSGRIVPPGSAGSGATIVVPKEPKPWMWLYNNPPQGLWNVMPATKEAIATRALRESSSAKGRLVPPKNRVDVPPVSIPRLQGAN